MPKILLVEEDPTSQAVLETLLKKNNHAVTTVPSCQEGLGYLKLRHFDVIILDWSLPDRRGPELCRTVRRQKLQTPILIVSSKTTSDDIVSSLDSGADDYIAKPIEARVFLAKVRALLRRGGLEKESETQLSVGAISLDPTHLELTVNDCKKISITNTECHILYLLMKDPNKTIPYARLSPDSSISTVRTFIKKLRRKLNDAEHELIQADKGLGYRFCIGDR